MVGSRGKGSRSKSKSKSKSGAVVPADPEPLNTCPPSNEEEDNETSNRVVMSMEAEDKEQLIADGGVDEERQFTDKVNDNEEVFAVEMEDMSYDKLVKFFADEGNMKVSDGVEASTHVDAEVNNEITVEEESEEEDSGINKELTNEEEPEEEDIMDSGTNNEIMNEEEPEEEEEEEEEEDGDGDEEDLINNGPDVITREELRSPEDTIEGAGINNDIEGVANNNEGMTSFEYGLGESMTEHLLNNKEASEQNAEEPMSIIPDNEGKSSVEGNENTVDGVKAVAKKVNQPRRKTTRTKLVKNKATSPEMQPSDGTHGNDGSVESSKAGASNEPKPQSSVGEEALGEACQEEETEHVKNVEDEKSEVRNVVKVNRKLKRLSKKVPQGNSGVVAPADEHNPKPTNDDPQSSVGKEALGKACQEDETEHVKNEEKSEVRNIVKVNRKLKRLRKNVPQRNSGVVALVDEHNSKPTNDEPESKEINQTIEQDTKNEGAEKSEERVSHLKNRKRKKVAKEGAQKVNANDVDKPGSSKKGKLSKRVESMGMIFMCSSETKKDCYRYKVLGLPAAKKELVSKIYKGMRLFLFDFELKMLYGIYKAADPGGYDIEPRAFQSKFPSQVRFTVLEDCLPLAEENFKNIIKDNYYTKNKFNCELTNEQVKNLCRLFHETTKKAGSNLDAGVQRTVASSSSRRDRKRKRVEDNLRVVPVPASSSDRKRSRRKAQKEVRRTPLVTERSQRRPQEEVRRVPLVAERSKRRAHGEARRVTDDRYLQPAIVYDRETYLPSVASAPLYQPLRAEDPPHTRPVYQALRAEDAPHTRPVYQALRAEDLHTRPLYQPLRIEDSPHTRSYTYERTAEADTYRMDYRDPRYPSTQELRYTVERDRTEPYVPYSEPHVYREPEYRTDNGREHYNYPSSGRYNENYTSAEYRTPLPMYRRY